MSSEIAPTEAEEAESDRAPLVEATPGRIATGRWALLGQVADAVRVAHRAGVPL